MKKLPIPGFEGLYEITSEGNVISNKRSSPSKMTLTKNNVGYLSVNLRTPEKVTVKMYISKLVYEAFGVLPEDYQENKKSYVVKNLDGDLNNNSINNLKLVRKDQFTKERFEGTRRSKKENKEDLPGYVNLFRPGIYSIVQIKNCYLHYHGVYHKVLVTVQESSIGPNRGSAFIRIKKTELPKYFLEHLIYKRSKKKKSTDYTFASLPLGVIILEEKMNIPRPTQDHRVGYKDFNFLNLTEANLIWETHKERTERMYEMIPILKYKIKKVGENNLRGVYSDRVKKNIERQYFLKNRKLSDIVRSLGLTMEDYPRVRYYVNGVKSTKYIPIDKEVAEKLGYN